MTLGNSVGWLITSSMSGGSLGQFSSSLCRLKDWSECDV